MQGVNHGNNRPAPAPIFNHRKRQRQAMFADPGASNHGNSLAPPATTSGGPGLMPVGGFNHTKRARGGQGKTTASGFYAPAQPQNYGAINRTQGNQMKTTQRSSSTEQNRSNSNVQNQSYQKSNYKQQQVQHTGSKQSWTNQPMHQNNSEDFNSMAPQQGYNYNNLQQQGYNTNMQQQGFNPTPCQEGYNSIKNQGYQSAQQRAPLIQQTVTRYGSFGNTTPTPQTAFQPTHPPMARGGNQSMNQSYGSFSLQPMTQGWREESHMVNAQTASYQPTTSFNSSGFDDGFGPTGHPTTSTSTMETPKTTPKALKKTPKKQQKDEVTLKMLTAHLSTVAQSAAMSDTIGPHMFEVFGVLDSAVVSDKTGTGKEFVLRDETGMLTCIFFEIDRQLPRLIRGQWQRCVGVVERRTGRLKCVSVRGTQGEERQVAKLGNQHTNRALAIARRQASEQ